MKVLWKKLVAILKARKLIASIIVFILLSLTIFLLTSISNSKTATTDLRTLAVMANKSRGMLVIARVLSVDRESNFISLDSIKMLNSEIESPGIWTANLRDSVNLSPIKPGSFVLIDVDPPTFSIENRSFSVTSVIPNP